MKPIDFIKTILLLAVCGHSAFASGVSGDKVNGGITRLINTVVDVVVSGKASSYDDSDGKRDPTDGAGFIIDENGYIVTNCHVIGSNEKVKVILYDGGEYVAKIIGKDARSDIALLKIDTEAKLAFVQFADSDKSEIGDPVIAIGNPFGFGKTVTSGIVSYKGRNLSGKLAELGIGGDLVYYLQTDAAVNCGNSGGPLFSYNGEVIGMITVFFSNGMYNTGINFAIPSNTLKRVIKELKDYGKMKHSWLGISVSPLSKRVSNALGLGKQHGCVITKVESNSPAVNAGIQTGDILISLNDEIISEDTNLEFMLNNLPIGRIIPIQILRHKVGMKLSIRVETRSNDDSQIDSYDVLRKKDLPYEKINEIGIGVTELTTDLRKMFDIQNNINGVVVSYVDDSQMMDITVGNVILMVNQTSVSTIADLKTELYKLSQSNEVRKNKEVAVYIFDPQLRRFDYVIVDFKVMPEVPAASAGDAVKHSFQTETSKCTASIFRNFKNDFRAKWHLF